MNHKTTIAIIRIIIAALAISMLVAGPNMATLQQKGYAAPQTKKQEQSTIQSLHGNFGKRSGASQQQHINQENQCLRTGKCGNAALGEQTQGNDNSVTGFADQSKNVQSRVVITPTPTPTPIGTPMTGTLHIDKNCPLIPCPGIEFSITVTGNNPQPSSFTLRAGPTQFVSLGPGTFTVTETPVAKFLAPIFIGACKQTAPGSFSATGTISAGQSLFCTISNPRPH